MDQHCSDESLSAYLDGDLASEAAGKTAEHLAACEVCRQSLAEVRAIRDAAPAMEELAPPEKLPGAIRARIRGSQSRRRRLVRLLWVGTPALAAALLVVAFIGGFGPSLMNTARSVAQVGRLRTTVPATAVSELSEVGAAEQTAQEYGEYVRGIDRAIDECRAALQENPGNIRVRAAFSWASSDRQRAMDRLASGGDE